MRKSVTITSDQSFILIIFDHHSGEEMTKFADLCKKYNVIAITDEVYEWMIFTIGTAGKLLTVTGWKVGWAYGPAKLLANLQVIHQNCVYTCTTPNQANVFSWEFGNISQN